MGIKHYFGWFKDQFSENIYRMKKGQKFNDIKVEIDTLMIDMNGVFHNSAQKVYQYGNYKPRQQPRFLVKNKIQPKPHGAKAQLMMFEDVCQSVDNIFKLTKPNKSLVLCVDGPAPLGKQCIAAGTKITLSNGTSCVIENIKEGDKVLGWNGEGFTSTPNLGLQIKGNKETIKLTFIDGRTLICTPDHRILVLFNQKPVWKEAGELQKGDFVVAGLDSPLDILGDDEKDWVLKFGDMQLSMNKDREKLLILSRIIGYISVTPKTLRCALIMGTRIDAELCVEDIYILTGKRPVISKTTGDKGTVYTVGIPREWAKLLSELPGMPLGKRIIQPMTIPDFLLKEDCPLSLIREFVAGLFGGNGHVPRLNFNKNGNSSITPVKFSQSIVEKYQTSFLKYMEQICQFLDKLGVSGTTIIGPQPHTYQGNKMKPKDIDENPRVKYSLQIPINTDFGDKVGYRYAHNKSLRLTIASSYWRLCNKIRHQEEEIIILASNIYDNQVVEYKCSYGEALFTHRNSMKRHQSYRCSENTEKNMHIEPSHCTMDMALRKAIDEYKKNNIIFHHLSIPSLRKIYNTRHNGFTKTNRRPRNSLDAVEFLKMTNTGSWFKLHSYPYEQEEEQLPMYICPIVDICANGNLPVYDIEVIKNHSFLANGLCVHNCQQRQRRFRSALEQDESSFNSNCITPGTKFMDFLTKYMDWYIRKRVSEDEEWKKIKVIFSNEKACGEGEAKLMSYVRSFGSDEDKYCIYGLDADLIMLALATHKPNFYILRDDLYDVGNEFYCLDIGSVRYELANLLKWNEGKHAFSEINGINDFIFMCFIVGNDFLPHIPSIEIIEGGIDLMIEIYKEVGISYGHLTRLVDDSVQLRPKQLGIFLGTIGQYEKENFEAKLAKKESFFPDPLLEKCSRQLPGGKWSVDIEKYKEDYFTNSFPPETVEKKLCHDYIEGMQWVLSYYTRGVPNWKWYFPYHYAPPASVIAQHTSTFTFPQYPRTISATPFQQLLCVLPPKSANLIPYPLCNLLTDEKSPLRRFCPDDFEIDLSGKRREWEGIVILPMVDFRIVYVCYLDRIELIDKRDMKRNKLGRSFIYEYSPEFPIIFRSYYGDIEKCCVRSTPIDL